MIIILMLAAILGLCLVIDFTMQVKEEKEQAKRLQAIDKTLVWDNLNNRWN